MSKQTSLAKTESNRRNALSSTGPKTAQGKAVVKWNALKHGLLSKEIVISVGDGKESAAEFRHLLAALTEDLEPEGVLEEMLVEKIAVCYWRARRALCCEVGEIRDELDSISYRAGKAKDLDFANLLELRDGLHRNMESALAATSQGIGYLLGILDDIRGDLDERGRLGEETRQDIEFAFGHEYDTFGCTVQFYFWVLEDGPNQRPDEFEDYGPLADEEECKRIISEEIDEKKASLDQMLEVVTRNEALEVQSEMARLSLPKAESSDRIMRYETTIERQLYRAMNQLERLQRQRRGECPPPTVNVDLLGQH